MPAPSAPPAVPFEVVAIVTSAGGLEAMTTLLGELPAGFPAAIVVGQHLSSQSTLAAILGRRLALPVQWVAEGTRLLPGRVYVCPPHQSVQVRPDHSCALTPVAGDILSVLPLNMLLKSLADSCGARALAIVLTGMGFDGAMGARALKAAGGALLVQSEASAEFPDMPRATLAAAAADVVLPVSELARALRDAVMGGPLPQPHEDIAPGP